jgi:hypothetical protein
MARRKQCHCGVYFYPPARETHPKPWQSKACSLECFNAIQAKAKKQKKASVRKSRQVITPEVRARYEAIVAIGCVACLKDGIHTTPVVHHLLGQKYRGTGRRANPEHSIGLCPYHHDNSPMSAHKTPDAFSNRYGTQEKLLAYQNQLLGVL